jgi:uncharacterized protein YjiS (DUF1127 family)
MFGFMRRITNNMSRSHRLRATARELASLDDRQLSDIGICRGQIPAVAAGQDPRLDPYRTI